MLRRLNENRSWSSFTKGRVDARLRPCDYAFSEKIIGTNRRIICNDRVIEVDFHSNSDSVLNCMLELRNFFY